MQYKIIHLEEQKVIGILKRITCQDSIQVVNEINSLWREFMNTGVYDSIENKVDATAIGLYTDYEGDFTKPYSYISCCQVSNVTNLSLPLIEKNIPGGKYAKFTTRGHIEHATGALWQEIWNTDLDRLYSYDFEVYHNNSKDINDQLIDIYISIK